MDNQIIRALLIDDDEDDYVMTRDLLSEAEAKRFDLEWVSTYKDGLKAIERNEHNVYLLDYRLGEQTGLELLREAIEKGCKSPIILLTGQGDHEVDVEAMKAGAADYLSKSEITGPLLERSIRYAIERKRTEEQIRFLAYYDKLTSLPNRALFNDRLRQALAHAKRYKRLAALLFLDLDNFKQVNDTLGHHIGDLLLKSVAELLMNRVRKSDTVARHFTNETNTTVARLGGDEFIILLTEVNSDIDVAKIARRILDKLSKPSELEGHEVFITTSIGIALYPADGEDIDSLVKNADTAMYQAKYRGKNNYQYYSPSMSANALERLSLENDLRRALKHKEFQLYYQPQVNIRTGKINGMEALIRWNHPDKGIVPPSEFIPLAEETGLIIPMGEWVLHTACMQNKAWQKAGFAPIRMSVNISGHQFDRQKIIGTIEQVLDDAELEPRYLELEITESVFVQKAETTTTMLKTLRTMGLRFAMDDFGTGYSSLCYLKHFPLDVIKIDQSFVEHINVNRYDAAIVIAIIAMARSLGLEVIAEGVETEGQLAFLHKLGCYAMQGYLLSRPLSAEDATKLLIEENRGAGIFYKQLSGLTPS